tara:strand:+ start:488 stop:856 length:369 start_codon:yes stop_codon:yes gene_type:complete
MDEKTKSSESSDKNFGKERADEVLVEEEPIFKPQNELPFPTEIDLNELFPQSEKDLNDLFPDEETKSLLKKMQKNKKDLHIMTDRFLEENWNSDPDEGFVGNGELEIKNETETPIENFKNKD